VKSGCLVSPLTPIGDKVGVAAPGAMELRALTFNLLKTRDQQKRNKPKKKKKKPGTRSVSISDFASASTLGWEY